MIVGLTGGIGCGKSTVLTFFQTLSWRIFDADGICRGLYERRDPAVVEPILSRWGNVVITAAGELDRRAIAAIVFQQPLEREWLNALFHPLVRRELEQARREAGPSAMILCDVPLLYEAGWQDDFEAVIAVWCDAAAQQLRLRERGWDAADISQRLAAQWPAERKLELADYGIINNGGLDLLQRQCVELDQIIRKYHG